VASLASGVGRTGKWQGRYTEAESRQTQWKPRTGNVRVQVAPLKLFAPLYIIKVFRVENNSCLEELSRFKRFVFQNLTNYMEPGPSGGTSSSLAS
jgi:hypothetical protein